MNKKQILREIENIERKKTELCAEHIRWENNTDLSWAEKEVLKDLDFEINQLKKRL